jgi:hypothetical protein
MPQTATLTDDELAKKYGTESGTPGALSEDELAEKYGGTTREATPEEKQAQEQIRSVIKPTNSAVARLEHIATHQYFPKTIEETSAAPAAKFGADMMMGNVVGGPLARLAEAHVLPALKAVPYIGRAISAIDEAPTVLGKVARGATVGGVTGGVEGLIRGQGLEGSAKEAGKGALLGGALGLALPAVHRLSRVGAAPEVAPETPAAEPAAGERLQPVKSEKVATLGTTRDLGPEFEEGQRAHDIERNKSILRNPNATAEDRRIATSRLEEAQGGRLQPVTGNGRGTRAQVEEIVNQATGVKPLKPDVPLREQLSKVTAGEPAEVDPIKAKYPEATERQMVRANGERIYEAAKSNPETVKAIHDLTRVELRQALINAGEDMGQTTVSNSKFAGKGSIPREEAFNRLLDKKLTPEKIVELAKKNGAGELTGNQTTEDKFFDKKNGEWAPERQAIHQKVINDAIAGKTAPTGRAPEATITVGGTGAGKTTLTRHVLGENPNIVNIDADVNKLHIPEFEGLKETDPLNAAFRVHEESSHIAKRTVAAAVRKGLDFIFDTSTGGGGDALFEKLKQSGYKVRVLFADVPTDTAIERAMTRARSSVDPANRGRYVPESVIREKHAIAAKAFDSYRRSPFIDEMHGYDTTGRTPQRFYERVGPNETIHDQGKIDAVQQKAAGRAAAANKEPALVR